MAQNFLDQVLTITGLKLSPATQKPTPPPIYRDEVINTHTNSSEISSVERYQQKKNASTGLTGTAKYLAKKQQKIAQEAAKLTTVDKYLAKKQRAIQEKNKAEAARLANMTGVEKYLFKLEANKKNLDKKTIVAKKIKKPSSVDEYVARQEPVDVTKEDVEVLTADADGQQENQTAPIRQETKEDDSQKRETEEPKDPVLKDESQQQVAIETIPEQAETRDIINLTDKTTQCQAATVRGSQCRRKSNLKTVEKTIDGKTYQFLICSQHDNDAFVAFKNFLQQD